MSNNTNDANKGRSTTRRNVIIGGVVVAAAAATAIFAPRIIKRGGGSITIGSFQDNAMAPFRDYFVKEFQTQTGITVNYNETNYDSW
ncbi:MAG TPA: hypothetical protein VGJ31_06260, partial [Dongiaceae bacterium]